MVHTLDHNLSKSLKVKMKQKKKKIAGTHLPFSSSLFFFVSPFPSRRSPFSPSFSILVVFRSFLVSPSSSFYSFPPCSPWWRILFFCLGATPPAVLLANLKVRVCIPRVCCLVSCVLVKNVFHFSCSLFSISIWTSLV